MNYQLRYSDGVRIEQVKTVVGKPALRVGKRVNRDWADAMERLRWWVVLDEAERVFAAFVLG